MSVLQPCEAALADTPMQIISSARIDLAACVLTIGAFDGVHRGHRMLIGTAVAKARALGVPAVVYTFDTPPKCHFAGVRMLTQPAEKARRIAKLGVDCLVMARFDAAYARRTAAEFLSELAPLNPACIIVGDDFRFGAKQTGDIDTLRNRYTVEVMDDVVTERGNRISSTRIRRRLDRDKQSSIHCFENTLQF